MRTNFGASKVRIFIDFWNFSKNWKEAFDGPLPEKNLDWRRFPEVILEQLDEIRPLRSVRKELRAVKVYASTKPLDFILEDATLAAFAEEDRRSKWLNNTIDQLTSYTVDVSAQVPNELSCGFCGQQTEHYAEQGVDTKMAIDLVALASRDLFDIAVLVTDDTDLIPSIQCVQNTLDKQVVHLGFDKRDQKTGTRVSNEVRNEAWGHLFINDFFSAVVL